KREEARKKRNGKVHPVSGFLARLVMSVRNVSGTYAITDGTLLPGYNQETGVLGFNPSFDSGMSSFIMGHQPYSVFGRENGYDISTIATANNWLVQNENLNRQYTQNHSENLNIRATLEPIKNLSVEMTFTRTYSKNRSEFYRWNELDQQFE